MLKKVLLFLGVCLLLVLALLHWWVPGYVENGLNQTLTHSPYEIRPEIKSLHGELFVGDLHSDALLWKRDLLVRSQRGHVDLPRLQAGNVALQVFSATTKSPSGLNYENNTATSDDITKLAMAQFWPVATWTSLFARAEYQLQKLQQLAQQSNDQLMVIKSRQDLKTLITKRANGEKTVGAIYLIEGAHPLEGEVDNLDRLFEQGLRIVGLVHFFDNKLGGSLHGTNKQGLTEFGQSVIRRANKLNLVIDVAHSSPRMVRDVLSLSTKPILVSHGGLAGHCDKNRNLSDELMRDIAEGGGLLGVGYWDAAVCDPTPLGIVGAIRYAIDVMGIDHVALGSDFDGAVTTAFDTSELAILTQTMVDQGFTETEIRKVMGENMQAFFLQHLP